MAMATNSVSSFAVFFILFLVTFEMPEIEAQDECLKEYGGDVGFRFCAPRVFPPVCVTKCREDKGAKGGRCIWDEVDIRDVKCLCDYCNEDALYDQYLSGI